MRRFQTTAVPPRPIRLARRFVPRQLWPNLTVESQERALVTLSRIVAKQRAATSAVQEVTNERS